MLYGQESSALLLSRWKYCHMRESTCGFQVFKKETDLLTGDCAKSHRHSVKNGNATGSATDRTVAEEVKMSPFRVSLNIETNLVVFSLSLQIGTYVWVSGREMNFDLTEDTPCGFFYSPLFAELVFNNSLFISCFKDETSLFCFVWHMKQSSYNIPPPSCHYISLAVEVLGRMMFL